jgi:glyoxylase-like metal-dependent hydrolase (beta-lactamase superfamily II)
MVDGGTERSATAVDVIDLLPNLRMLRFPVGQAYLWRDPDSLTLVDTGLAGAGPDIARAVTGFGLKLTDLDRVVLTHFHEDHTGSAAEIGAWEGVTVTAHRRDAPIIRGHVPGPPPVLTDHERELHAAIVGNGLSPAAPARVDRELEDGDMLPFGGGAYVLAVPGHTDGSIAIYLPHSGVLFTGDNVATGRDGQVILGPFNLNRSEAIRSFRRVAALDSSTAVFGHGDPVLTDAAAVLREASRHFPSTRDSGHQRGGRCALADGIFGEVSILRIVVRRHGKGPGPRAVREGHHDDSDSAPRD